MSGSKPCAPGWASGAWPALALALLTGLLWLWCRPLLPIDETRYLSVAWEMWLRGDFIVPYKNGAVYVDKPPLLFWLMQAGWALFGVNEWWPRLVPTLAAMAGLLLTARLAAHLWPQQPKAARLAPWLLASALLWQVFTGAVMFDTLLSVFSLLCLNALVAPPLGRGRWAWFALGIGGGLLTKGPVILLHTLPAALLAPWWWAGRNETGQWRRWYGGLLLGLLGGAAILAAWLWPAIGRAGASYGAAIGIHQTSDRLVHSYSHRRPWWWYLQLLPALPLPWTFWPPLYRGLARLRGARRPRRALLPGRDAARAADLLPHQRQAGALPAAAAGAGGGPRRARARRPRNAHHAAQRPAAGTAAGRVRPGRAGAAARARVSPDTRNGWGRFLSMCRSRCCSRRH